MKNVENHMPRAERDLGIDGIIKILNDGGSLSAGVIKLNVLGYHVSFGQVKGWMAANSIRTQYVQLADSPDAEVAHE